MHVVAGPACQCILISRHLHGPLGDRSRQSASSNFPVVLRDVQSFSQIQQLCDIGTDQWATNGGVVSASADSPIASSLSMTVLVSQALGRDSPPDVMIWNLHADDFAEMNELCSLRVHHRPPAFK